MYHSFSVPGVAVGYIEDPDLFQGQFPGDSILSYFAPAPNTHSLQIIFNVAWSFISVLLGSTVRNSSFYSHNVFLFL